MPELETLVKDVEKHERETVAVDVGSVWIGSMMKGRESRMLSSSGLCHDQSVKVQWTSQIPTNCAIDRNGEESRSP